MIYQKEKSFHTKEKRQFIILLYYNFTIKKIFNFHKNLSNNSIIVLRSNKLSIKL
jgi:hypothetical protein